MFWKILIFLSSFLLITFLIHLYIYVSLVKFFSINSIHYKYMIIASLLVLASSFFIASFLIHISQNYIFRLFYLISSLWYGLAILLIIASSILWIIKGILSLGLNAEHHNSFFYLSTIVYSLVFAITAYGFVNALTVRLNRIDLSISNLPSCWCGRSIVHLSDLHIGPIRNESYLLKVVTRVNQLEPDIVAITGDLFDGASFHNDRFIGVLSQLRAKMGVIYVSGNHEVYADRKAISALVKKAGIIDLDNNIINFEGLLFIGIGSPSLRNTNKKPFEITEHPNYQSALPKVLLFHTPTDFASSSNNSMDSHSRSYLSPDVRFDTARKLGISLQLSGHSHAGQFFPFTWLTKVIFNGFHRGLHRIGTFNIHISSGTGTWGPPLRIFSHSEITEITLSKL